MKYIFIGLIRLYQKFVTPYTPARCKYYPTCSCYAVTAFKKHGAIGGLLLSIWRILRCNPWSMGGIDHVPEKFTFKVKKYDYLNDLSVEHDEQNTSNREVYEN